MENIKFIESKSFEINESKRKIFSKQKAENSNKKNERRKIMPLPIMVQISTAIKNGNLDLLKTAIADRNYLVDKIATKHGYTVLSLASTLGDLEIIKFLLSKTYNLSNIEKAIYQAAQNGHKEIQEILVTKFAILSKNPIDMNRRKVHSRLDIIHETKVQCNSLNINL